MFLTMGGTHAKFVQRHAKFVQRDRFIQTEMEKWIQTNGREPTLPERLQLVQEFRDKFFGGGHTTSISNNQRLERNIKLRF